MEVETFFAVRAVTVTHEEVAFGHLAQVVLVKKLAVLALLAESTQPMLADEGVEPAGGLLHLAPGFRNMAFGASRAVRAVAGLEGFAYRTIGRQADLVRLLEERREAEAEPRRRVVENGGRGGLGAGDGRHRGGGWTVTRAVANVLFGFADCFQIEGLCA